MRRRGTKRRRSTAGVPGSSPLRKRRPEKRSLSRAPVRPSSRPPGAHGTDDRASLTSRGMTPLAAGLAAGAILVAAALAVLDARRVRRALAAAREEAAARSAEIAVLHAL